MAISWIQPSFAGGEIGPSLYGRIDIAKYQVALRKCDNFIVRQYVCPQYVQSRDS